MDLLVLVPFSAVAAGLVLSRFRTKRLVFQLAEASRKARELAAWRMRKAAEERLARLAVAAAAGSTDDNHPIEVTAADLEGLEELPAVAMDQWRLVEVVRRADAPVVSAEPVDGFDIVTYAGLEPLPDLSWDISPMSSSSDVVEDEWVHVSTNPNDEY